MNLSTSTTQPKFPKQGSTWKPLPRGKQANRVQTHAVVTINASPEQVFNTYARAELLPTWQEGVISVERTGAHTLHWKMEDPGTGKQFEFDAEEVEVSSPRRHVSRVTTGPTAGTTATLTLHPHPAGRGTIATMVDDFTLPGGAFTNAIGALVSRSPQQITTENMRHLKELLESGEIPTVEGQSAGTRGITGKLKRYMIGENMPTPPGTRESARPEDLPSKTSGSFLSSKTFAVASIIALPLVIGGIVWSKLSGSDKSTSSEISTGDLSSQSTYPNLEVSGISPVPLSSSSNFEVSGVTSAPLRTTEFQSATAPEQL